MNDKSGISLIMVVRGNKKEIFFALVVVATLLAGIMTYIGSMKKDQLVAIADHSKIYRGDIEAYLLTIKTKNNEKLNYSDLAEVDLKAISDQIYLDRKLIKLAKKSGVTNDEKVVKAIKEAKKLIIKDAYLQTYIQEAVSAESLQASYQSIVESLEGKKEYNLSHIFMSDINQAKRLRKTLRKSNFAAKAKLKSKDGISGAKGGNLGYVRENLLAPEILNVLVELKDGQISLPIQTEQGVQIIWRKSVRDVEVPEYKSLEAKIKKNQISVVLEEFYKGLIKEGNVELVDNL